MVNYLIALTVISNLNRGANLSPLSFLIEIERSDIMKSLYKYLFYLFFIGFAGTLCYVLLLTNAFSPIFEAATILMEIIVVIFLIICIDLIASPAGSAEENIKNENVKSNNSCEE